MGTGSKHRKKSSTPQNARGQAAKKPHPPKRPIMAKTAGKSTVAVRRKVAISTSPKITTAKASAPRNAMNKVWKSQLLVNADTRNLLIQAAGEHALHVIQEFTDEMSDEEIAKKTKIRASDVRVVLNKLHSHGLASYTRSRDKNSGWYSYVWRLNNERAPELVQAMRDGLDGVENTAVSAPESTGGSEEYFCRSCGPDKRLPFEEASNSLFKCSQCGTSLEFFDNSTKA
jgi:transcription initiation factor TFIIE subunit alpha